MDTLAIDICSRVDAQLGCTKSGNFTIHPESTKSTIMTIQIQLKPFDCFNLHPWVVILV